MNLNIIHSFKLVLVSSSQQRDIKTLLFLSGCYSMNENYYFLYLCLHLSETRRMKNVSVILSYTYFRVREREKEKYPKEG